MSRCSIPATSREDRTKAARFVSAGLSAVLVLVTLTECVHRPVLDQKRIPISPPAELLRLFEPGRFVTANRLVSEESSEQSRRLVFSLETKTVAKDASDTITVELFLTRRSIGERGPLILVAPILAGDYSISRKFCYGLAEHGFHSFFVHRPDPVLHPRKGGRELQEVLLQMARSNRVVLRWLLEEREEVDAKRVGSLGISLGALVNGMLIPVDEQIRSHVLIMPGGSVSEILLDSRLELIKSYRTDRKEASHLTDRDFAYNLKKYINIDPLFLSMYMDNKNILMFLAAFDQVIPYRNGKALYEALGQPELYILPTGHYTASLFFRYVLRKSLHFFQRQLAPSSEKTAIRSGGDSQKVLASSR